MLHAMTSGTFGHDFLVIILRRYVGMKLGMTVQAIKAMLAVALFEPVVFSSVAGPAIYRL